MTAKDELGDYSISTSFGGRKKVRRDRPVPRPATRGDTLRQIYGIYAANEWTIAEQACNHRALGLPTKALDDYTDAELQIILADMEKYRMILFEE